MSCPAWNARSNIVAACVLSCKCPRLWMWRNMTCEILAQPETWRKFSWNSQEGRGFLPSLRRIGTSGPACKNKEKLSRYLPALPVMMKKCEMMCLDCNGYMPSLTNGDRNCLYECMPCLLVCQHTIWESCPACDGQCNLIHLSDFLPGLKNSCWLNSISCPAWCEKLSIVTV